MESRPQNEHISQSSSPVHKRNFRCLFVVPPTEDNPTSFLLHVALLLLMRAQTFLLTELYESRSSWTLRHDQLSAFTERNRRSLPGRCALSSVEKKSFQAKWRLANDVGAAVPVEAPKAFASLLGPRTNPAQTGRPGNASR